MNLQIRIIDIFMLVKTKWAIFKVDARWASTTQVLFVGVDAFLKCLKCKVSICVGLVIHTGVWRLVWMLVCHQFSDCLFGVVFGGGAIIVLMYLRRSNIECPLVLDHLLLCLSTTVLQ